MARAIIAIVDPQHLLADQAEGYLPDDIHVEMGQDPNTTEVTGERDAVFRFLTDDLGVDAAEANEYIDREEDEGAELGEPSVDDEDPRDWNDARHDMRKENPREGVKDFDKFMDRILISEGHLRVPVRQEDSPQRLRAARHQDRPGNKIRFGGK